MIPIFLTLHWLQGFFWSVQELAKESPELAIEQVGIFLGVFFASSSFFLILLSGWIVCSSMQALHAKQFPPPGTRVIRETRVRFGAQSQRRAILNLIVAAVLTVCSMLLPWYGWQFY